MPNPRGPSNADAVPADIRRRRIIAALDEAEFVRVAELSERLGTSEVTVRSDLEYLANRGMLRRVHGGAVRTEGRLERAFEETQESHAREKQLVAQEAAALVSSGDTIILDVGTTTTALARELVARRQQLADLVVFTSALNIALLLEEVIPTFTVLVTGGTLRPLQHSLVDPLADLAFERIHVATAFVGCNGVDARGGVTNVNLPEADVKRRMLQAADRRVILADGSKIGQVTLARLCDVDDVDLVITDVSADARAVAALQEAGTTVRIAGATDAQAALD